MISDFFKSRIASFAHALAGIKSCFRSEINARIHMVMTILVVIGGVLFNVSRIEWMLLIILIGFVWTAELLNTAIENIADLITNNYDPRIKRIKDMAAGAVLIAAICSATIGLLIFIPRIIQFVSRFILH